jgi:F0F1-type ATP synthase delta subunit
MDLSLIISAYKELLNEYVNKLEVNVYSKYPLTEEQRVDVSNKLKNYYQKKIILNELVDESLIGGIKIELEQLFGCSVDVVRLREKMDSFFKEQVMKEVIYV